MEALLFIYYAKHTHTCRMHTVMITSPDFLEKNENVAEEVPLVSTCLLISVTFNVVPPPNELVNAPVCAAGHFSCPDMG